MRPLVAAIVAWTAVCGAILLGYPAGGQLLGCMRLVGRSLACEAAQEAVNRAWFATHTLPVFAFMLTGYLVVAAAALVSFRRRRATASEAGSPS